ncbi:hypothetical protein [Planococcus donghaensis]|uniref:hypothetical protein n=1 Tax=Planococcus donghaensis TaxID=414778 RepID=UPI003734CC0D
MKILKALLAIVALLGIALSVFMFLNPENEQYGNFASWAPILTILVLVILITMLMLEKNNKVKIKK